MNEKTNELREQLAAMLDKERVFDSIVDILQLGIAMKKKTDTPEGEKDSLNVALRNLLHDDRFIALMLGLEKMSSVPASDAAFIFTMGLFAGLGAQQKQLAPSMAN